MSPFDGSSPSLLFGPHRPLGAGAFQSVPCSRRAHTDTERLHIELRCSSVTPRPRSGSSVVRIVFESDTAQVHGCTTPGRKENYGERKASLHPPHTLHSPPSTPYLLHTSSDRLTFLKPELVPCGSSHHRQIRTDLFPAALLQLRQSSTLFLISTAHSAEL